ncbi:MAG: tyrosine--tRNA ligase, partial [Alphaproteobacteria bacterium]
SGTELIRRTEGATVHALGTPLITNSDGTKFGKSEGNAIWLDPEMTSPYAFYQFWLNTADADVVARLREFTFLTRAEVDRLATAVADEPFRREAQRTLAFEVTALVHGPDATQAVIDASAALFGNGELSALDPGVLRSAIAELPGSTELPGDADLGRALVETGLVKSLGEARRSVDQGGVYVNNARADDAAVTLSALALPGGVLVVRRGKKTLAGVTIS